MGSIDKVFDNYSSFRLSCVDERKIVIGVYTITALDKRYNPRKVDIECHRISRDEGGCTHERCEFYHGKVLTLDDLSDDDIEALKKEETISSYRFRLIPIKRSK